MSEDAMSSRHRPVRLVRAITAVFVFAVGMLGGAGVAADRSSSGRARRSADDADHRYRNSPPPRRRMVAKEASIAGGIFLSARGQAVPITVVGAIGRTPARPGTRSICHAPTYVCNEHEFLECPGA